VSKSRRRRVNDAATPQVRPGDSSVYPRLKFVVSPIGKPNEAVTFDLWGFQVRDMLTEIRKSGERIAVRLESEAAQWRLDTGVPPRDEA